LPEAADHHLSLLGSGPRVLVCIQTEGAGPDDPRAEHGRITERQTKLVELKS
jgi:hypothetical protein